MALSTPLMGAWPGTVEELTRRVPANALYIPSTVRYMAEGYLLWAARFGLDARVLWAQMLLETNGLRFGGEVAPALWNFCGLRRSDGDGYYSFSTPLDGVIAHVAHLAVHALPACPPKWINYCVSDPKHPAKHWNDVRVVGDLGKGPTAWCPTAGYASAICRAWNEGV